MLVFFLSRILNRQLLLVMECFRLMVIWQLKLNCAVQAELCRSARYQTSKLRSSRSATVACVGCVAFCNLRLAYNRDTHTQKEWPSSALSSAPRVLQRGDWLRPAETQEVCHIQRHYNEHCLGLGRQALILHGSHRELEAFKPAEGPCYHSHPEVLALPLLSKSKLQSFFLTGPSKRLETLVSNFSLWKSELPCSLNYCRSQRNKTLLNSIL